MVRVFGREAVVGPDLASGLLVALCLLWGWSDGHMLPSCGPCHLWSNWFLEHDRNLPEFLVDVKVGMNRVT